MVDFRDSSNDKVQSEYTDSLACILYKHKRQQHTLINNSKVSPGMRGQIVKGISAKNRFATQVAQ